MSVIVRVKNKEVTVLDQTRSLGGFALACFNYDNASFWEKYLILISNWAFFTTAIHEYENYKAHVDESIAEFFDGLEEINLMLKQIPFMELFGHDFSNQIAHLKNIHHEGNLKAFSTEADEIMKQFKQPCIFITLRIHDYSAALNAITSDVSRLPGVPHILQAVENQLRTFVADSQSDSATYTVKYEIECSDKNEIVEIMSFSDWRDFMYMDFYRGLLCGHIPKRCKNCGTYFLLTTGHNYEYCDNIAPNETKRTCRMIGAMNSYVEKVKNDPVWHYYNLAYKKYHARFRKGTLQDFNAWATEAVKLRDRMLEKESYTDKELQHYIENLNAQ